MRQQMIQELSDNFTWAEACITNHREFDNDIPADLYGAIKNTAKNMEKVRALLNNSPIYINSWYRSVALNVAIGGSKTSQHCKGEAVDFIAPKFGDCAAIVRRIWDYHNLIPFDQLIYEHTWTHISFVSNPNVKPRKQVLTLLQDNKYAVGLTDKQGQPL